MNVSKWDKRQQMTRVKVMVAARELICEDGLEGLSVRRLAAAAGVAVGTIYNQFGDRSGVLMAMVRDGLEVLADSINPTVGEKPLDATRSLLTALLDRYEAEEEIWRPVFLALKSEPVDHGLGVSGERLRAFMLTDLAAAERQAMFEGPVDIEVLADHLLDAQVGLLVQWAYGAVSIGQFRERSTRSLELALAAVLTSPHRALALERAKIT
jgi:AcrR family transcriptional regulator